jgi:hypothetical protein
MGAYNLSRSLDKHIGNDELDALVPSRLDGICELDADRSHEAIEAQRHIASCPECRSKVQKYSLLLNRNTQVRKNPAARGIECPQNIDWHEVAAGLWPESRASRVLMHAALCDQCGPLLRAAIPAKHHSGSQEDTTPAAVIAPRRSDRVARTRWRLPIWQAVKWLAPASALIVVAAVLGTWPTPSRTSLSAAQFSELAVNTHRQHAQGNLALEIRSDSQQAINQWLKEKSPFSLVLPASSLIPGEKRPYRPEGARVVRVGANSADFIAYQTEPSGLTLNGSQPGDVSLMVIPASVAVASGGVELPFKKVSFHYATVSGYKVVTWSVHGLTYALVSREDNSTQRSCMVCHSAMKDRDFTHTPTPLVAREHALPSNWH